MPNKKKNKKQISVAYEIKVNADRNGNFTYTANGNDASAFQPNIGDTLCWSAKLRGNRTAFQVEFPGIGPFGAGPTLFRSLSKPTAPQTVALLPHYQGNLVFKYIVTLANGWYDDPVITPVPADPLIGTTTSAQIILLSVDNTGNFTITPPVTPIVKGRVAWQWDTNSAYTDDFVLTFAAKVPYGWPPATNSQAQIVVLNMQTPGTDGYTINTVNTGLSASSTLTIP